MKRINIYTSYLVLLLITLVNYGCKKTTGIKGDNNDNNTVVIGEDNFVWIDEDRRANSDNIGIEISLDNTSQVSDFLEDVAASELNDNFSSIQISNLDNENILKYKMSKKNDTVFISPDLPYLNSYNSRIPITVQPEFFIHGNYQYPPFFFTQYPKFDLKVVNNSDEVVFFDKVVLNIEESHLDKTPLLYIDEGGACTFRVFKESWGTLYDCSVNYNILNNKTEKINYQNLPFRINLGDISDDAVSFDIRAGLGDFDQDADDIGDCSLEFIRLINKVKREQFKDVDIDFGNDVLVIGTINYTWTDHDMKEYQDAIPFEIYIPIIRGDKGGYTAYSFNYGIMLDIERRKYQKIIPISQSLKPKEADRFSLVLGSEKSAIHKFNLRVYYQDDKYIETGNYFLKVMFPKSYAGILRQMPSKSQFANDKISFLNKTSANLYTPWVENLRMRTEPNLNSEVVLTISPGDVLISLNEFSDHDVEVVLRGRKYSDKFLKVKTDNEEVGWVHFSAIKQKF